MIILRIYANKNRRRSHTGKLLPTDKMFLYTRKFLAYLERSGGRISDTQQMKADA
jgi:hypothetical protein